MASSFTPKIRVILHALFSHALLPVISKKNVCECLCNAQVNVKSSHSVSLFLLFKRTTFIHILVFLCCVAGFDALLHPAVSFDESNSLAGEKQEFYTFKHFLNQMINLIKSLINFSDNTRQTKRQSKVI